MAKPIVLDDVGNCVSKANRVRTCIALYSVILGLVGLWFTPSVVWAQSYPTRNIHFIVPFPPGGVTDLSARYYARRLSAAAGVPVIVENRGGANGFIGINAVLSAPPDGHTVLLGTSSHLAGNVALFRTLPYDPISDFTPITMLAKIPSILIVSKNSQYQSAGDLMRIARERTGTLNFASGATSYQLLAELFNELAQIRATNVPYRGVAEALTAILSNNVDFTVLDVGTALGPVQSGIARGLFVASNTRLPVLPDVPTSAEVGIPEFLASPWIAAVVSSKTPQRIANQLTEWLITIVNDAETHA
jgi:tripartite-type tricarboxylate transporter receptor subunit TctC